LTFDEEPDADASLKKMEQKTNIELNSTFSYHAATLADFLLGN